MNNQEARKLEHKVTEILKKYVSLDDTVILGVSGGSDSMFLLHILKKIPCKLIVAHINHQLRGKESDLDAEFVKKHTAPGKFFLKKIDIKKLSLKVHRGIEETGRKQRYDFFQTLAKRHKAKYIITAHQADENIETIIFNFARGASLQGLCGIQQIENSDKNTILLRPLVHFSKKQILEYLKLNDTPFRADKSNEDTQYKRNFIRKKIIPNLKEINPSLVETVSGNIQNIEEINDFIKELANEWLVERALNKAFTKLDAKSFRNQNIALKKMILIELYKKIIGNTTNLESSHIDEVIKIIDQNVGNKSKKLGKLEISVKNQIIHISNPY